MLHLLLHFTLDFGQVRRFPFFLLGLLYLCHLVLEVFLVQPRDPLAVLPKTCALHSVNIPVDALAMLLTVLPLSCILPSILPRINTKSVLLVVEVFAFVASAVLPRELALTVHVAVGPVTLIRLAIFPLVDTDAIYLIVFPVALVHRAVRINILASAVLGTLIILTDIA